MSHSAALFNPTAKRRITCFSAATLSGQQDVGSTAVAQADHFSPAQEVQLLGYDGALAVTGSQAVTAV